MTTPEHIAVIGLGYVGLPLAVALARHFPVTGFDIDGKRLAALAAGNDVTGEVDGPSLAASTIKLSGAAADIGGAGFFIVTVPTPVDANNRPDLGAVLAACRTVGGALRPGAVVVFESTVYPGVTEDICGPALERASGLLAGRDFFLGYSPERINPGDREHTVERIVKVIAGQTPEVTERMAQVYGKVTSAGVFRAAGIKTAEAAKCIENAQRDINIAFINEVALTFNRLGMSMHDVLDAAATKWNFLKFQPGLVGGHCIGVDPYYLAACAEAAGLDPRVVLSGRQTNDAMGGQLARLIDERLRAAGARLPQPKTLVLGLTFKEDVPDLRNSKVVDLIEALRGRGHVVDVHDPKADADEALALYGLALMPGLAGLNGYDCLIGAVAHADYLAFDAAAFAGLLRPGGLAADIKGMWRGHKLPAGIERWQL